MQDAALLHLLHEAAAGRFPPADGATTHLPSPSGPADAVLGFFFHHVIASDVDRALMRDWTGRDPFALSDVRVLAALADRLGTDPGIYDSVYAAVGGGATADEVGLVETEDRTHPRVARALRYRIPETVRVFTDPDRRGVLVMGRGLARRMEAAFEVDPAHRGAGLGSRFVDAARRMAPEGEPVFLQVSPANTASMRAVAKHPAFRPIGSEILYAVRSGGAARATADR